MLTKPTKRGRERERGGGGGEGDLDGRVVKEASLGEDGHESHHSEEKRDGVQVNPLHHLIQCRSLQPDSQREVENFLIQRMLELKNTIFFIKMFEMQHSRLLCNLV